MEKQQPKPEQTEVEYQYFDWNLIIERLKFHRKRLNFSKEEMKQIIQHKYHCSFMKLPDEQIFELGFNFKASKSKEDFYQIMKIDKNKLNKEIKNKGQKH